MTFILRTAIQHDLPHIQKIYNREVLEGFATWNHEAKSLAHFEAWFLQLQQDGFPLFVAEHQATQTIAGFADYSTFRQITGFKQTVEHSVFVDPSFSRLGLGKQLLELLIQHAQQQHIHVMVAAIDHENIASIRLHEQLGFQQTGYMPEVGRKLDTWRNLVLMQLILKETAHRP